MPSKLALAGEWSDDAGRRHNVAMTSEREFHLIGRTAPERVDLERFITERYASTYGARVRQFAEQLVGFRNAEGAWVAALGYTRAGNAPLFAEQYLDRPVEETIGMKTGSQVQREHVVEVGNLAATSGGAARQVILAMTQLLHELACTWVVFTSTRLLLNSFARLSMDTIMLTRADPRRLPDRGESWGRYYETDPRVMTANIPMHFLRLCSQGADTADNGRH